MSTFQCAKHITVQSNATELRAEVCVNMIRSAAHCTVEELDTLRSTPFSTGSLLKERLTACNSL